MAGLVGGALTFPLIFLGPPAGALVDRWDRRRVMIVCDAVRCLAVMTVPVAWALRVLNGWPLLAVALALKGAPCRPEQGRGGPNSRVTMPSRVTYHEDQVSERSDMEGGMGTSRAWIEALSVALVLALNAHPVRVVAQELPYTFFLTRYEVAQSTSMTNMGQLERVRYHSDGKPFAKATDGSTVTMSGQGAWEPTSKRATGGGQYTITDASGAVTSQGAWRVTGFISFQKLPGWWGIPGLKEEGWQGPPGSTSFSGFLKVSVNLDNQGDGVLEMWCLMPGVAKPGDHTSDGIALTGGNLNFPDYHENEKGNQGIMFYSTDPADDGNVLTAEGTTTYRAGTPRTLPATGEYDDQGRMIRTLVLAAVGLALIGAGVALRRRLA